MWKCPLDLTLVAQIFPKMAWFCKCSGPFKLFTPTCQLFYTDISVISNPWHFTTLLSWVLVNMSSIDFRADLRLCFLFWLYLIFWVAKRAMGSLGLNFIDILLVLSLHHTSCLEKKDKQINKQTDRISRIMIMIMIR